MARLIVNGDFVGPGERLTAAYLEVNLPASWVVVCNKVVASPNSSREIDFVVIGEHTVFAVEEKHWSGVFLGNEQRWWPAEGGPTMGSPINQVHQAQQRLRSFLEREVPGLSQIVGSHAFIQERVILSHDQIRTQIADPRVSERVLRLRGCEEDFVARDQLQATRDSIHTLRDRLIDRLAAMPDRAAVPTRIGDYEVLEVLSRSQRVVTLHARHASGSERILKLVERPSTADDARSASFEAAVMREWDALQVLSGSGLAPSMDLFFSWSDGDFWVFPIHLLPGLSLRADLSGNGVPTSSQALRMTAAAFEALAKVHAQDVVHRSISPDAVHVLASGSIAFSGFQIARIEGSETVFEFADEIDGPNPYRAPECRTDVSLATRASDVFSLAAALRVWVVGEEIREGPLEPVSNLRPDLEGATAEWLDSIFRRCLSDDREERPSALEVTRELSTVESSAGVTLQVPGEFEVGDVLEDRFEIIRRLGSGVTAVTYLVNDRVIGSRFVVKALRNPRLAPLAVNEFRMLADVMHPSLVRVFEVYPGDEEFLLKLEYVEGLPLRDLAGRYLWNAESVATVGIQMIQALTYLTGRDPSLTHRDISPTNILIPDDGRLPAKLIDFGFATLETEARSAVGTPLYRAPEVDAGGVWSPACDVYSLAAVLMSLLIGRPPFEFEDGAPLKSRTSPVPAEEVPPACSALLAVLRRQLSIAPDERYPDATAFCDALRDAVTVETVAVQGDEMINPSVDDIRRLYRNTILGNADNRGLDSVFARETYVDTALDVDLAPIVGDGRFRLVVLSGNPGDGKTAFLQRLKSRFTSDGARVLHDDDAGWRLEYGGRQISAVFDASESHGDKTADDLLHDLLAPLSVPGSASGAYIALMAANDGRLISFFERFGKERYSEIWAALQPQLFAEAPPSSDVMLVDLKRRTLSDGTDQSLFDRLLDQLVTANRWAVCDRCVARLECPILINVRSMVDRSLGPQIRARFRDMLLAVHLRRERRPTIRDLRSAMAFVLTHDLACEDVHTERREGLIPAGDLDRLYHNAAFEGGSAPDLVLDEWSMLDPALTPRPALDRFLYFHRRPSQRQQISRAFASPAERPPMPGLSSVADDSAWLRSVRRRYLFEGTPIEPWSDGDALPDPGRLFPYRYLPSFVDALVGGASRDILLRVLRGITVADGVPLSAITDGLALLTGSPRSEIAVIKRYPAELFELVLPSPPGRFVESISDSLVLRRTSGSPSLQVALDLFEFLMRSSEGLLPGSLEQHALLEDVTTFRNHLLAEPSHEVLVLEAGRRLHEVAVEDHRLVLKEGRP